MPADAHQRPVDTPPSTPAATLPPPARYFPLPRPRHAPEVGLTALGTDLGNGKADAQVFQIDSDWPEWRRAKQAARARGLARYVCAASPRPAALAALLGWLLEHLPAEHPAWFARETRGGCTHLHCRLSGETLVFGPDLALREVQAAAPPSPPYVDALDALACQVQEDLTLIERAPGGGRLSALHLCCPNHWAAPEKIGGDFAAVHAPVPGMGHIARQGPRLVEAMIERGPFVRFAWGLASDTRLDHHPVPPPGVDAAAWRGRRFDPARPRLVLRIERQVSWGLPVAEAAVFIIRTHFRDVRELDTVELDRLRAVVGSMDAATLAYKGLANDRARILAWLDTLCGA